MKYTLNEMLEEEGPSILRGDGKARYPELENEVKEIVEEYAPVDIKLEFSPEPLIPLNKEIEHPFPASKRPRITGENKIRFPGSFLSLMDSISDKKLAKNLLRVATFHEIGHIVDNQEDMEGVLRGDLDKRTEEFQKDEHLKSRFIEFYGKENFKEEKIKEYLRQQKVASLYAITQSSKFFGDPIEGIVYALTLAALFEYGEEVSGEKVSRCLEKYYRMYYPDLNESFKDEVIRRTKDKIKRVSKEDKKKLSLFGDHLEKLSRTYLDSESSFDEEEIEYGKKDSCLEDLLEDDQFLLTKSSNL